jgi:hypothetical protein
MTLGLTARRDPAADGHEGFVRTHREAQDARLGTRAADRRLELEAALRLRQLLGDG